MPNCPICETEYIVGEVKFCIACGWEVQPILDGGLGNLNSDFVETLKAKYQREIAWAKQMWQSKQNFQQVSQQKETNQEHVQQLKSQLEQLNQEHFQTKNQLQQVTDQLAHLQNLLEEAQSKLLQADKDKEILLEELDKLRPPTQKHRQFSFSVLMVNVHGKKSKPSLKEAKYFTENLDNSVALEMVLIPGGTFQMGALPGELKANREERPNRSVAVSSFCMGKFPITQAQWEAVMKSNPSYFKGSNLPIEQVSWNDAIKFCARLNELTGRDYRLPSEAEWEYACRAGSITPFHFGDTIISSTANYDYKDEYIYGNGSSEKSHEATTPVGKFQVANDFGLYDMHGNVFEWCADPWHENYRGMPPTDGSVWHLGGDDRGRVARGGAWYFAPWFCRSAARQWFQADKAENFIGFRVVCSVV